MGRVTPLTLALLVAIGAAFVVPIAAPPPSTSSPYRKQLERVVGTHGYVENGDSPAFLEDFRDPGRLFRKREVRQSRPLFVLAGTLTGVLASPVAALTGDDAFHLGAQLLNALLLAAAVLLAWWLLRRAGVGRDVIAAVIVVLVVNDVTKAFVWTAHTQMMSILAPLVIIAGGVLVLDRPRMSTRRFLLLGVAAGLGMLVSGFFLVALPVLVAARLLALRRAESLTPRRGVVEAIGCTGAVAAPVVLWVAIVRLVVGTFYSHETAAYRQFVWIGDALDHGVIRLLDTMKIYGGSFASTFGARDVVPVGVVTVLVVLGLLAWGGISRPATRDARDLAVVTAWTAAGLVVFLYLLGFYRTRLTFALVPPLLVVLALLLEQARRRWPKVVGPAALGAAGVWVVSHVVLAGPYS